ncbi:MAG: DUF4416 family protein [Thermodesulfobacteriota bacterium]
MSNRRDPDDVKRIASLISPEEEALDRMVAALEDMFGPADWRSSVLPFDRTRYYEREMGAPLVRVFVSFEPLMRPEGLVETKLETDRLEDLFRRNGRRTVNVDPGYICLERLVLATGKNYTHRIYLCHGVFADLTLVYHRQSFRVLPWTYPDYADPYVVELFNSLRNRYKARIRGLPAEAPDE